MQAVRRALSPLSRSLAQLEAAPGAGGLAGAGSSGAAQQAAGLSSVAALAAQQHAAAAWQLLGGGRPWAPAPGSGGAWQLARHYSQCDCPTLGGPQPDVVVVEYDDEEVDRFIELADAIEAAFPNVVVEGNSDGPGRRGSFEVRAAGGQLLHSRLNTGAWPQPEAVLASLGSCGTQAPPSA
ncbi:hypothetical protein HT031_003478 [Scenedesmus sp. PABB004]|nr:hypothetical protein HT031_003478 [Scenedesmus sp. PABB004]